MPPEPNFWLALARALTEMGNFLSVNASESAEATGTEGKSMATAMFAAAMGPLIEEAGNMIAGLADELASYAALLAQKSDLAEKRMYCVCYYA